MLRFFSIQVIQWKGNATSQFCLDAVEVVVNEGGGEIDHLRSLDWGDKSKIPLQKVDVRARLHELVQYDRAR